MKAEKASHRKWFSGKSLKASSVPGKTNRWLALRISMPQSQLDKWVMPLWQHIWKPKIPAKSPFSVVTKEWWGGWPVSFPAEYRRAMQQSPPGGAKIHAAEPAAGALWRAGAARGQPDARERPRGRGCAVEIGRCHLGMAPNGLYWLSDSPAADKRARAAAAFLSRSPTRRKGAKWRGGNHEVGSEIISNSPRQSQDGIYLLTLPSSVKSFQLMELENRRNLPTPIFSRIRKKKKSEENA